MSKRFLNPINLVNLPSDPLVGSEGDVYYNTVADGIRLYKNGAWTDLMSAGSVPAGGASGQILAKASNADYSLEWIENYANYTETLKNKVKNGNVEALFQGTPVYVSGSDGTNVIVSKAGNQSEITSSKTLGLLAENLATNGMGFVITNGKLGGLNTTGSQLGDPVWLGPSGTLVYGSANMPTAPAHLVYIGVVTKVNGSTGEIFVKVQNGYELNELHNVALETNGNIADNEILGYDLASGLWKNQTSEELNLINTSATEQTKAGNLNLGGNLVVTGDFTVNGTTTTINTETLNVEDNIVLLNSNVTGTPIGDAGIEIERGTEPNKTILWKESNTAWNIDDDVVLTGDISSTSTYFTISSNKTLDSSIGLASRFNEVGLSDDTGFVINTNGQTGLDDKIWTFENSGNLRFPDSSEQATAFLGISAYNTDDVSEGTTNLYFTDARALDALSADLGGTNGGIRIIAPSATSDATLSNDSATHQVIVGPSGEGTNVKGTMTILASPSISDPGNLGVAGYIDAAGSITGSSFIVDTGTSSQFLKADGSLDSTSYAPTNSPIFSGTVSLPFSTSIGTVNKTEISYLSGLTSGIQGQLNAKLDSSVAATTYLSQTNAAAEYLTQVNAATIYLSQDDAALTYQPIGSYLTSETDPIFVASTAYNITSNNVSDWNTAYGWGDHSLAGYLTSYTETQTLSDVTALGSTTTSAISINNTTPSSSTTTGALTVSGGVGIGEDLYVNNDVHVGGDIHITGTITGDVTQINVTNLSVTDPLIYLAENNPDDSVDIGIFAALNHGAPGYSHTGLIRDASDSGKWKLVSGLTDPVSNVIDFTSATFDTLVVGDIESTDATFTGTVGLNNVTLSGLISNGNSSIDVNESSTINILAKSPDNLDYFTLNVSPYSVSIDHADSTRTFMIGANGLIQNAEWAGDPINYLYGGTGLTSLGTAGQTLAVNSTADALEWVDAGGTGAGIFVSATPPASPTEGMGWFDNETGEFYVYDGTFWVDTFNNLTNESVMDIVNNMISSGTHNNIVINYDDLNNTLSFDVQSEPIQDFLTLNPDVTGTPTLNAGVAVNRGDLSDVAIRWNETEDQWEYTNDGVDYQSIGSGGGAVSTMTSLSNSFWLGA